MTTIIVATDILESNWYFTTENECFNCADWLASFQASVEVTAQCFWWNVPMCWASPRTFT